MLWYSLEAPHWGASNEYDNMCFYGAIKNYQYFFAEKKSALSAAKHDSVTLFETVVKQAGSNFMVSMVRY